MAIARTLAWYVHIKVMQIKSNPFLGQVGPSRDQTAAAMQQQGLFSFEIRQGFWKAISAWKQAVPPKYAYT